MANLSHVIYRSIAIKAFSEKELLEMLKTFREKNKSLDVTGMLLYDDNVFFQVIEGEDAIISQLYDSIKKDSRHRLVTTLVKEEINARDFLNWSMGFYKVNQQQLNHMEGINDFFTKKECLSEINLGIAKKLLQIFCCKT
jgi:hypothetical protein